MSGGGLLRLVPRGNLDGRGGGVRSRSGFGNLIEAGIHLDGLGLFLLIGELVDHGCHRRALLLHRRFRLDHCDGSRLRNRFRGLLDGRRFGGLRLRRGFGFGGTHRGGRFVLDTGNFLQTLVLKETGHGNLGRDGFLASKPLRRAHGGLEANGRRVDVILEVLGPAGHNERDRLDVRVVDGLERASNFVVMRVDPALGDEGDTALGIARLVFGKVLEFVVLELKVADVAVTAQG